ncbi:cysteine hydrolase [Ameyamaea chiangmaiensis]|uniref:Cysteine hydrolase n=1 Tax=Ameyamaea chiangmaiensis TaxID=442969 RepID=A0A850P8K1_9PROT|nr:isochorismatase family cysteine hydrolase [Ameyamaea chiangmaiensis]MBS4075553.1 cysteine hydrolase [Ameyamaea chiangmaiensis]NVN40238.1 cysteine hydrolase [Ameyamaea chiangmaiensis]
MVKPTFETTRDRPIYAGAAALLFVDTQNYNCRRDGGEYAGLSSADIDDRFGYFFDRLDKVALPNWIALVQRARQTGVEVIYTVIESLTQDGRDRSLDYKITGFNVPRGSLDARVIDPIAPQADEIVIPKTSSSVFMSTNIDYLLRNLGVRSLIIVGCLTDQCVDSAIRDACDLGYLVTCVTDACLTQSQERHDWSLRNNKGYARQIDTDTMLAEMTRVHESATA